MESPVSGNSIATESAVCRRLMNNTRELIFRKIFGSGRGMRLMRVTALRVGADSASMRVVPRILTIRPCSICCRDFFFLKTAA